ncbi:MAG TPA: carbon monoxide dehydrogenase subunit G [Polyangiales bacterium]|nr:carbon monoxide dehydrogenase subunit G [Polyangiales bacterium]
MQITGQETIAAPRQQVWDSLLDPETLKRCIPGCQSLTQEADNRLRVIAEVKIGPIGARFNALVTRSDVTPLQGYTMQIEGHGGTVGFVKSTAKLRLSEGANGATVLGYDLDAEVGGRLAQLGGPILDATSKQLSGKFFRQLSSVLGTAQAAATTMQPAAAEVAVSQMPKQAAIGVPVAWLLALCVAALVGYLVGHADRADRASDWMGLALGLLIVIVAAAGFEFGKRSAPVVMLDPAALARLLEERKK